jgi:hypothetical protein
VCRERQAAANQKARKDHGGFHTQQGLAVIGCNDEKNDFIFLVNIF